MNKLLSCRFNMDTNRVEARFEDGTTLAIDCIAVEDNPFMAGAFHGVGEPEKVINVGVSEDHKLGAAEAALLFRERRRLFHRLPHQGDSIHVDSRLGRADVD